MAAMGNLHQSMAKPKSNLKSKQRPPRGPAAPSPRIAAMHHLQTASHTPGPANQPTRMSTKSKMKVAGAVAGLTAIGIGAAYAHEHHLQKKKHETNLAFERDSAKKYDMVMDIVRQGGGMEWKKSFPNAPQHTQDIWHDTMSKSSAAPTIVGHSRPSDTYPELSGTMYLSPSEYKDY